MTIDAATRGISWHWSLFGLGAAFALPALVVIPFDTLAGLALAVGVMPAAAFPLPGPRRGRHLIPVVGVMSAAALVLGSLLTAVPPLAVVALFVFGVAASLAARRSRAGALLMALALPLTGIGLSFGNLGETLLIGFCIIAGSVYAWLLSLAWPDRPLPTPPARLFPTVRATAVYGVLLGLAGATAAIIGFLLDLEHVGWATGAALLVMRPARDQLVLRGIGRALSVLCGALAAALFALASRSAAVTAVAVALVLAALAATQGSHWYIAPGFTTFIALTLVLQSGDRSPGERFNERTVETLLGVGVALVFGVAVPAVLARIPTLRSS